MSANTDNYIAVNYNTGQIICTGTSDQIADRPVIFEDESNNTIMILALKEGESFKEYEDLNYYFDNENYETKPKQNMNLVFSHAFVDPIEEKIIDDEGNEITIQNYYSRINVSAGEEVTISNIPNEVDSIKIFDGHAGKEYSHELSDSITLTRDYEELTKIIFLSPKHFEEIVSLRFIAEDSEYGWYD